LIATFAPPLRIKINTKGGSYMATMLTHLRVADRLVDKLKIDDGARFFLGVIAPDDGAQPDVTHWCVNGDKTTCDCDGYYDKYIKNNGENSEKDYFIGYYIHLRTDVLWHTLMIEPIRRLSPGEIRTIKRTWNAADRFFMENHPDFRPAAVLRDSGRIENGVVKYADDARIDAADVQDVDSQIERFVGLCEEECFLWLDAGIERKKP